MSYKKALEDIQNMPTPDYTYIIQPVFKLSKEASEQKLRGNYNAEDLKIGASGTHTYDEETREQTEERFWLKSVVLNSDKVVKISDEAATKQLAESYAKDVLTEITNIAAYSKIEILFLQQWNDGQVKSMERKFFFTVPELEETSW